LLESDFWHELAEKFRKLDPTNCLRLQWILCTGQEECEFNVIGTGEACRTVKVQFEALATRAGIRIARYGDSLTRLSRWLEEIRTTTTSERTSEGIRQNNDGTESTYIGGMITRLCEASADLCNKLEVSALETESNAAPQPQHITESDPPKIDADQKAEREALRDAYLSKFFDGPKIKILDICWAAEERYREWKRWLQKNSPIKIGSKPDLAFRSILKSGKRPIEYRPIERPAGWQ
jgi:hypothetical protein